MAPIRSVAIIGAGPAGAITVDALAQEGRFDRIRLFERREKAGGCWIDDPPSQVQQLPDFEKLASRKVDEAIAIPATLPVTLPHNEEYRFAETSIYPTLETNIDAEAMSFSQEPMPDTISELGRQRHGNGEVPFRHWKVVEGYIQGLLERKGYESCIEYDTTVELVQKGDDGKWVLTLRKVLAGGTEDRWWTEKFDAVVVAAGHFFVPFIPSTPGLAELARNFPGLVEHSKAWRDPEKYRGKRVVVVGASVSGTDISFALAGIAEHPLNSVVRGKYHPYFSDWAFQHPSIKRWPAISHIVSDQETDQRTIHFEDGTKLEKVDHLIFGTGYTWTCHFFPQLAATIRNNRLPNLYQHVFWREDPTLCFVGAIAPGFTFKVFEWQAVLVARFLAGRIRLPPLQEQIKWEEDRIALKGDGVAFTTLYPDFESYFEEVRLMCGEPTAEGKGRKLVKWEKSWEKKFEAGHVLRIEMWKRENEEARKKLEQ